MVKGAAATAAASGPGVYSATYSGIPVYEFQFGADLKEHVMRRRHDNWINATHILKAAGFDKPARTRILERDVQKDNHEKIQGGYGKYQGTWIPLEAGEALARRHSVYDRLRPIFEYTAGNKSPPPAPRHATKPKVAKAKPLPPPKWGPSTVMARQEETDNGDSMVAEDDTPDNLTVASASFMADDDRFELPYTSTGHGRRKREENEEDQTEQQHAAYGDELLDYFLLSRNEQLTHKPEPPTNFQPDWLIDAENHTALHWASAMGDVDVIKQLKRCNANTSVKNIRGETPFMRSVHFTNCYEKQTFPAVMKELFDTIDARDHSGCTVIHHAAIMKNSRVSQPPVARYYLDNILNKLLTVADPTYFQQLIDMQDNDGNTALHLAAQNNSRKCIRALLGRNASADIANHEGVRAENLIKAINASRTERGPQRSSSPYAPDSQTRPAYRDALAGKKPSTSSFQSVAATTLQAQLPQLVQKFQDLAKSYEEQWQEKQAAEVEARRILANTQQELKAAQHQIAELEAQLEPDDVASKLLNDVHRAKHQVLQLIQHQNRVHIHQTVENELNRANGDGNQNDSYAERLALARKLQKTLVEQREAEMDYVVARSEVGTGDNIDKYRRLLNRCLGPKGGEILESSLDSIIEMMEEEKDDPDMGDAPPPPAEPLGFTNGV